MGEAQEAAILEELGGACRMSFLKIFDLAPWPNGSTFQTARRSIQPFLQNSRMCRLSAHHADTDT